MKNQTEAIHRQLVLEIKREIARRSAAGEKQKDIAVLAGINAPFISNFLSDNEVGMHGLSLAKLISIANGLGLKIKVEIIAKAK